MGIHTVMESVWAYRLLQAPFEEAKLAPFLEDPTVGRSRRVLDVGCGPGTNTQHFAGKDYLGVDISERYIRHAIRRHRRRFIVADVSRQFFLAGARFDLILVNSLLHHLNAHDARMTLANLAGLLQEGGVVHILDLVLPARRNLAYAIARADRGDFPRPLETWRELFAEYFDQADFRSYGLGATGITLWQMVYFKGRARGS